MKKTMHELRDMRTGRSPKPPKALPAQGLPIQSRGSPRQASAAAPSPSAGEW